MYEVTREYEVSEFSQQDGKMMPLIYSELLLGNVDELILSKAIGYLGHNGDLLPVCCLVIFFHLYKAVSFF